MSYQASFRQFTIGDTFERRSHQQFDGVAVHEKKKMSSLIRKRIETFFEKGGKIEVVESVVDNSIGFGGRVASDSFERG